MNKIKYRGMKSCGLAIILESKFLGSHAFRESQCEPNTCPFQAKRLCHYLMKQKMLKEIDEILSSLLAVQKMKENKFYLKNK